MAIICYGQNDGYDGLSTNYEAMVRAIRNKYPDCSMFKEKPTQEVAKDYIAKGALWNGGVFAFKLGYVLNRAHELIDFVDYDDLFNKYDTLNKISFDYAVVEHEPKIEVMRFAGTWKDLGTWNTLTEAMDSHAVGEAMFNENCENVHAGKVQSPAARKLQSGAKLSLHFRKSDEPLWSAKAVDRILHNEVYIGKLVQGKTRRLDYRSKKKMNVPMRDWVIVDNTHEAIIPAEQFELVRRILETETRRPNDAETVALFAGFLYCGDCGSRLVRRSASYKGKRYIYYQCSGSKQNKGSCTSHNLRDEKLHNIVRNALQMQIQIVMEEAEFVESIRQAQQEPYRVRRIERQIRQLTAEKAHTQGIKEKLYGDYAEEILTREDFLNYNELYSKRIEEYDRKITELEAERQNLQTAPNAYPFLDVYRKYRKLEEITRPMVVELIEKIEVYEGNRVEITFRFHDEIADLLEELHQKQMRQHEVSA